MAKTYNMGKLVTRPTQGAIQTNGVTTSGPPVAKPTSSANTPASSGQSKK